jgi:two-component system, NarL family, sensor kinase
MIINDTMKKCSYFLLIIYLVGLYESANAQSANISMAKQKIYNAATEEERLTALVAFGKLRNSLHGDTIYYYAQWAKKLALQLKDKRSLAWATYSIISADLAKGKVDSVTQQIDRDFSLIEIKRTDAALYYKIQLLKANALNRINDRTAALDLQLKILGESEKEGNINAQVFALNYIGATYLNVGRSEEARQAWMKGLQLIRDANNPENNEIEVYILSNLALLYFNGYYTTRSQQIKDSFFTAINKAIELSAQNENLGVLASALSLRGNFYGIINEFTKGETDIRNGLGVRKAIGDPFYIVNDYIGLSSFYTSQKEFKKCIESAAEGIVLADKNGIKGEQLQLISIMANAYKTTGNFEQYSQTLERFISTADSSIKLNAAEKIADVETKYEVQKKETLIAKQKLEIFKRNLFLYGGGVLITLLLLLLAYRFKKYQRKQKIKVAAMMEEKKRQHDLALKESEEKERKRIASELHDNLGVQANAILYNSSLLKTENQSNMAVIADLQETAREMLQNLRETLWAMKTADVSAMDLWLRIINFMKQMGRHYTMLDFKVEGEVPKDFMIPSNKALNIVLVVQETVNNAVKHAVANRITAISSGLGSNWMIVLKDDGKGFETDRLKERTDSYGLENMKERALSADFQYHIESTLNIGTTTSIMVNG